METSGDWELVVDGKAQELVHVPDGATVVNPFFLQIAINIKVAPPDLKAFEHALQAIPKVSESIQDAFEQAIYGMISASFGMQNYFAEAARRQAEAERIFYGHTFTTLSEPYEEKATSILRQRLSQVDKVAEQETAKKPRSAQEFLAQKRARARVTQQAQRRERVKPWEDKGKRFR